MKNLNRTLSLIFLCSMPFSLLADEERSPSNTQSEPQLKPEPIGVLCTPYPRCATDSSAFDSLTWPQYKQLDEESVQ